MRERFISALISAVVAFLVSVSGGLISQEKAGQIANTIVPQVVAK